MAEEYADTTEYKLSKYINFPKGDFLLNIFYLLFEVRSMSHALLFPGGG